MRSTVTVLDVSIILAIISAAMVIGVIIVSITEQEEAPVHTNKQETYKTIKVGDVWVTKIPGGTLYDSGTGLVFVKDEKLIVEKE